MLQILIPTDFSDNALNALTYAQYLFKGEETTFTLFNSYEPFALQLLGNKSPLALSKIYRNLKDESEGRLSIFIDEIVSRDKSTTFYYKTLSYSGHLKEGIASLDSKFYDYIVMGTKGATGLKEIFMGSTTHDIVSMKQRIPLLIIPEQAAFVNPESIGFATDFNRGYSKEELNPLNKVMEGYHTHGRGL